MPDYLPLIEICPQVTRRPARPDPFQGQRPGWSGPAWPPGAAWHEPGGARSRPGNPASGLWTGGGFCP